MTERIVFWVGPNGERLFETEGFEEDFSSEKSDMKCVKVAAKLVKKMGVPGEIKRKERELREGNAIQFASSTLCG